MKISGTPSLHISPSALILYPATFSYHCFPKSYLYLFNGAEPPHCTWVSPFPVPGSEMCLQIGSQGDLKPYVTCYLSLHDPQPGCLLSPSLKMVHPICFFWVSSYLKREGVFHANYFSWTEMRVWHASFCHCIHQSPSF